MVPPQEGWRAMENGGFAYAPVAYFYSTDAKSEFQQWALGEISAL
jgi:hypothetical protein